MGGDEALTSLGRVGWRCNGNGAMTLRGLQMFQAQLWEVFPKYEDCVGVEDFGQDGAESVCEGRVEGSPVSPRLSPCFDDGGLVPGVEFRSIHAE